MSRGDPSLTARELQVLASLILGKTNREIGKELDITESTVKSHLSLIFAKLGASNRTEAAILGLEIFPTLRASQARG
jgi:DNA-binding NarL/FixJ family response regulator